MFIIASKKGKTFKIFSEGKFIKVIKEKDVEIHVLCHSENVAPEILHYYYEESIESTKNISAEFCFILQDKRKSNLLFGVDSFATKPIYYRIENNDIEISTDLYHLVTSQEKQAINYHKIFRYFKWKTDEQPVDNQTFYEGIFRLLPAQIGTFTLDSITYNNYLSFNLEKPSTTDTHQLINDFKNTFISSVKSRVADQKIAANLSGGLDSSSVTATIRKYSTTQITTLYYDSETLSGNESEYADAVAKAYQTKHLVVSSPKNYYDSLKEITKVISQPDPGVLPSFIHSEILNKAKNEGCEVLFSGHGGDSIVGYGFEYLYQLFQNKNWDRLNVACNGYDTLHETKHHLIERLFKEEIKKSFSKNHFLKAIYYFLVGVLKFRINFFSMTINFPKKNKPTNYAYFENNILNKQDAPPHNYTNLQQFDSSKLSNSITLAEKNFIDFNFISLGINGNEVLSLLAHRNEMSVSFPFFDASLLEKSVVITPETRFGAGFTRGTIRVAMKGILPEKVRNRTTKGDFTTFANNCFKDLYPTFVKNFDENHKLWEIINKQIFEALTLDILNEKIPTNQKVRLTWLGLRVINFGIWLNEINDKK